MIIRRGQIGDVLKVSRLWLKMVNELAPDYTPNVEWWRSHAEQFLKNGNYSMFVAEEGGKLVGFLDFFLFYEPSTGKLHGIGQHFYVIPEYRGNCVSGKLYRNTVKAMKEKGCKVMELFCFDNEKTMWEKKGFVLKRMLLRRELSCLIQ